MSINAGISAQRRRNISLGGRRGQCGVVLMAMLTLLVLWGLNLFLGQLNAVQSGAVSAQKSASALAEAKTTLIGSAISFPYSSFSTAGVLKLPDLGPSAISPNTEGQESGNFADNHPDMSVLGRFPWKSLASPPFRDSAGECVWYVVSGHFKKTPGTSEVLNWDTTGQIEVIDGSGVVIASNLAALLISPGTALDGQNRALANPAYWQCGGNYDARNYLDAYNVADSVSGEVNYFAGSTNNRVAASVSNKRFVMTKNDHYNDQFLFITVDDIFGPIIKRNDFALAIRNVLDHPIFATLSPSSGKGTDALGCSATGPNESFCTNWKEMFFLTDLPAGTTVVIDGGSIGCTRLLIFSGKKTALQRRSTPAEKADKSNYLEGDNATSFGSALPASFSGKSFFDSNNPSQDVLKCVLP